MGTRLLRHLTGHKTRIIFLNSEEQQMNVINDRCPGPAGVQWEINFPLASWK
jgi:hypothetical protein